MSSKSKKLIKSILCIVLCSYLTGCLRYNPPEGYSEQHHTYDEMVEYAKSQSFLLDVKLILETIRGVFGKAEAMAREKKK